MKFRLKYLVAVAVASSCSIAVRAEDCASGIPGKLPAIDLAVGLQDRIRALSPEDRKAAEFRITHALHQSGLTRPAHAGYRALLVSDDSSSQTKLQALTCINRLERTEPALAVREKREFLDKVRPFTEGKTQEGTEYLFRQFSLTLRDEPARAEPTARILEANQPDSVESKLARAFLLAQAKKPVEALRILSELLANTRWPEPLERHRNAARVLAARSSFAIGQPLEAARWFRLVDKSANIAPTALEELSWALLEGERPGEAIGTALQLERGLLARTFAPEAPMVLAMSLNELCQFPAALSTVARFKRRWQPVHEWLEQFAAKPAALLPLARRVLRKEKEAGIPAMVGWELLQSPQYLAQESLQVVLKSEARRFDEVRSRIKSEQVRLARQIVTASEELTRRIQREVSPLTSVTESELRKLREDWLTYRALRRSMGPVRRMSAHSASLIPSLRSGAERWLEADLQRRTKRMKVRLDEVIENLGLVEIEILDGASRDLVWQNAHPEMAKKAQEQARARSRSKSWDWGSAFTAIDSKSGQDAEELWEDELGSHEVLVTDRCELRERHVAMQGGSS
jgi:hypothetical protein